MEIENYNQEMKVSIIIPIYNVEKYIEGCIASVANQTYKDYEIIAVNDGCTDSSMEVLKACTEKYNLKDKTRIINHDSNRGPSAARNAGIKNSSAEYLYFLDSDDMITPDCIEKLVGQAVQNGVCVDMVVGGYRVDDPRGTHLYVCELAKIEKSLLNRKEFIKAYCKDIIYPMAVNKLTRRDFVLKHGVYFEEGLLHEDLIWSFQAMLHINKIGIVNEDTYIYCIRENSIQTSPGFMKHFEAYCYIIGKMADIIFSSPLKRNRHVYNFLETEKQRYAIQCIRSGNAHLVRKLYDVIRRHPHYNKREAMMRFGWLSYMRKRIRERDEHYSLPFEEGLQMFINISASHLK